MTRYYTRLAAYLWTLMIVTACGVFVAIWMWLTGRRFGVNHFLARKIFYPIAKRALDVEVELEGEENLNTHPAVVMMNHQSVIDILFMAR
jgi:lysophosphatidate acyltransferase